MDTKPEDLKPGEFISIPAWRIGAACVDRIESAEIGLEDARNVWVYEQPDAQQPRRYRLEPGQFELL